MKAFLYFIPGLTGLPLTGSDDVLREHGLDHMAGMAPTFVGVTKGPSDGHGVVVCFYPRGWKGGRETVARYEPEKQTWRPMGDTGVWIGWPTGAQPGPDDLQRDAVTPGFGLRLHDGQLWHVPVARECDGAYGLAVDGTPEFLRGPQYAAFDRAVSEFERHAAEYGSFAELHKDPGELAGLVADVLGVNYYVSRWELLALELITRRNVHCIALAAEDAEGLAALLEARDSGNP